MTVRELRDRLNELIERDASYGDAPVYYDDAELNLRPIDGEEVHVVQALQSPAFRHDHLNPGDIFCSLNINRYDCEELDYWTGGAMVIPPDVLKERREEVIVHIATRIATEVYKFNFAMDLDRQFRNAQYNEETKKLLEEYKQRFVEKVDEEFEMRWRDKLSASFTSDEVETIKNYAKSISFTVNLTGNKMDAI